MKYYTPQGSLVPTGKLRQDADCHWFLIPDDKVDDFDRLLHDYNNAGLFSTLRDELEDTLISDFQEYMIGGGIGNLSVIISK